MINVVVEIRVSDVPGAFDLSGVSIAENNCVADLELKRTLHFQCGASPVAAERSFIARTIAERIFGAV